MRRRYTYALVGWVLLAVSSSSQAIELQDFFGNLTAQAALQPLAFDATSVGPNGLVLPDGFLSGTFDPGRALDNLSSATFSAFQDNFPVASTVAGFTYTFDPALNVFVRSTEGLGPLLGERASTTGRGKINFAFGYSQVNFDLFEGDDLSSLPVQLNGTQPGTLGGVGVQIDASQQSTGFTQLNLPVVQLDPGGNFTFDFTGATSPSGPVVSFNDPLGLLAGQLGTWTVNPALPQVTLDADIDVDTSALFVNYGVTETIDVGLVISYLDVRLHGTVTTSGAGLFDLDEAVNNNARVPIEYRVSDDESASGFGDVIARAKWKFLSRENFAMALRGDLWIPTGDEKELLGTGQWGYGLQLITSAQFGRIAPHANIGATFRGGGQQLHFFTYLVGADVLLHERASMSVDFLMSDDMHRDGIGDITKALSTGVKVNPWRRLVVSANLLWKLNNQGLRADLIPSFSVEYTFR